MLRDEQKEQAAKLKDRSFKDKLSYFWTYYKLPVIAIVVIIAFAIGIWQTTEKFDRDALQVVITDHTGDAIQTEDLTALYEAASETPGTLNFSTDLFLDTANADNDLVYSQKLIAMLNANTIDVFIAPETVFDNYGSQGMFVSLDTLLSEADFAALEADQKIVYADVTDEDGTTTVACGIRISGHALISGADIRTESPCIGIPATAAHPEEALRFLQLFLE